jgi:SAM-dependent methyltransferase
VNFFRWAKAELHRHAWKYGLYTPPDRRLLEREILPAIAANEANQRILSVGLGWYTTTYSTYFERKTFVTIDIDESRAVFAANPHIVGDLRNLSQYFDANEFFDVILMNGVIGYGLDTVEDVDRALAQCAARLCKGGLLLLGVNEEIKTHVDLAHVPAQALFEPTPFGRWPAARVMVEIPFPQRTHTFLFWRKKAKAF